MNANPRKILGTIGALALAASQAANAYETPVHREITYFGFTRAVQDRDFLVDLGLAHYYNVEGNLVTDGWLGYTLVGWTMLGSIYEDNNIRSKNHFFDPLAPAGRQGMNGSFQSAPDRAFDLQGNGIYSLPGTRDSLYNALRNNDPTVRPKLWRDTFRGLGQFTHLLQDMAQPQHVRNDTHFSISEQFYDQFPNYSRYEKRTWYLNDRGLLAFSGYPTVNLPTYRSYWEATDGKGLAQSTNLNFLSERTNLDSLRYASPAASSLLKEETLAEVRDVEDRLVATNITLQFVSYIYTDAYTGGSVTNDRLSALSFFDFQRNQMTGRRAFTLNNYNHERYASILIPQAVGYSAGLIGRFFRGSLEVTRPDENVYGIVDHSTIHQTDPVNGYVGFDTIKVKVRDATAGSEALSGGRLIAVAKFHRNGCYKDDMSGEFTSSGRPCDNYYTPNEEVVVSGPFEGESLDKATPKPYTFRFGQQIPINAVDLFIQIVYRGQVGNEPDELAIGTVDVFEPTFLALFNGTDHVLVNGTFVKTDSTPLPPLIDTNNDGTIDPVFDKTNLRVAFGFGDSTASNALGVIDDLPPARYSRLALITDRTPYPAPIRNSGASFNTFSVFQFSAERNAIDFAGNTYRVSTFGKLRDIPVFNSLTAYKVAGSPDTGDLLSLPALTNKAPYPVTTLTFAPPSP